jgi:hypothetical protein
MLASDGQPPQFYTQEEVQQILHLAIIRKTDQGELSREQLWEIAAELAIEPQDVLAAEQQWLSEKNLDRKRQEFNRYRRGQFQQKAVRYLIVNSFLVILNLITNGSLSWSLYVLLIWGIGLALEAWKAFQTQGEAYEQAFQHWNLKNEVKQSIASLWDKFKRFLQS